MENGKKFIEILISTQKAMQDLARYSKPPEDLKEFMENLEAMQDWVRSLK